MKTLFCGAVATTFFLVALGLGATSAAKPPVFSVTTLTVVAFFPPVTKEELDRDPDTNESLSDFQLYAAQVREPFRKAGIDFHETYTRVFAVRANGKTTLFRTTRREEVGYYFCAPEKKPRVEYGVMTSSDLLAIAQEYFGISVPNLSHDIPRGLPLSPHQLLAASH
jgi:hypothetical protein